MAAAAPGERPDREDLNVTSFKRGEWGSSPVPLDPGFPAVAEALGDADALTEVPQEALMAVTGRGAHYSFCAQDGSDRAPHLGSLRSPSASR